MTQSKTVGTRMAPSPTGDVHIGSLRTGLYAYALAKQNNGQFILRIEDTDQKRLVPGSAQRTMQLFKDFGLNYDEGPDIGGPFGPYTQTERLDIYQKYIKELLDKGQAYYCFCSPERLDQVRAQQKAENKIPRYDQHCLNLSPEDIQKNLDNHLPYVIRMKIPKNQTVEFNDLIRGKIKFNTNDLDDQVLIKSDGIPTYHFAVVVDDHLMNISHIIRAEEWISSTPKHILLYQYFGWEIPQIAHLTVLLDPTHSGKMSKRHGSVFVQQFLDDGYLPQALLNFLMLLGWNPGDDREIFTLDEFVKEFSIAHLHKKSAIFDRKKLDYFNGLYIRNLSDEQLLPYFKKFLPKATDSQINALIPVLKERIVKFSDLTTSLKFLFEDPDYSVDLMLKKGTDPALAKTMLLETKNFINTQKEFEFPKIQDSLLSLIKQNNWNIGEYFMILRVAICSSQFTPPVVEMLPILGRQSVVKKLNIALSKL